jgi:hypothetical protein
VTATLSGPPRSLSKAVLEALPLGSPLKIPTQLPFCLIVDVGRKDGAMPHGLPRLAVLLLMAENPVLVVLRL